LQPSGQQFELRVCAEFVQAGNADLNRLGVIDGNTVDAFGVTHDRLRPLRCQLKTDGPGGERSPSGVPEATSNPRAGIQFASQSVSSTNVTTKIATPKIMSCPRTKFGRSAALILIIAPPEQIEM
jgi:hypothetical protein